jgi:glycosyltransferase involved in cell wall biosynthesis
MKISAVICTHNRASYLRRALASLIEPGLADDQEVVVVNNACTDSTEEVVSAVAGHQVRGVYEPRLGLSHARNAGWRQSRGEYVAYLDDDAVAGPGWLDRIVAAFQSIQPRPGCVGGQVLPRWEAPRPRWLADALVPGLTILDWPHGPRALPNVRREYLVGANMAFPRKLLERFEGFTPRLDRVGKRLLSNGDIHLQMLITRAGYSCWYDPAITVHHHIPASRLAKSWFYRRYYSQGVSDAVMDRLLGVSSPRQRYRYAYRHVRGLISSLGPWRALLSSTEEPDRFAEKCFTLVTLGRIVGMLRPSGA